jgi:8-oxo-dGTP diphosphatase
MPGARLQLNANNSLSDRPHIHVVAGILRDADGRVLLAQRPLGKQLAGLWEFPGGKVEPGEAAPAALIRELDEELGIQAQIGRPLIAVPHGRIVLDVWEVSGFDGVPHSREGQTLAWVALQDIEARVMPPADRPVVAALRLPERYLISPTPIADETEAFLASIERAAQDGIRLIQLRLPQWERSQVARLARAARALCAAHGAQLLLHADWQLAEVLGLDGVHLPAHIARTLKRRPLPGNRWVGVSCHDAAELAYAARIGADFATLSPIKATASHPEAIPLGWERAAALIASCSLPVYALGGLGADDIECARASGAHGVAAIRAFFPDFSEIS